MKYKNFDTIYVNGCSHTAGGGLYDNTIKKYYKENFGISWNNEREINYPKYLSDHFKCDLVDDSMCGSGAPRLVRTTFEYIMKVGIEKAKETLFIFNINTPIHRLDFYSNEINDYLIVNVQYNDDGSFQFVNAVDSHSINETKYPQDYFDKKIKPDMVYHLSNYHNPLLYLDKTHNEVVGLFSFLELNNIEYYFGFDTGYPDKPFNKLRELNVDGCKTIYEFITANKLSISDETNGFFGDGHPGYHGHKKYAESLIKFLEKKLKRTLWVFGDSFSTKSVPEFSDEHKFDPNDFRVTYSNYKGYYPKHFPEIIAETLDLNLVNLAKSSWSNERIYQSYLENLDKIKPNDIVFFGWSEVARFNLVNRNNDIENIIFSKIENVTFEDNISPQTISEVLVNRSSHTFYFKWLTNYINNINSELKNNIVIHHNFFNKRAEDNYVSDYQKLLIQNPIKCQTISEDIGSGFDIHFSEQGHKDFADFLIKQILI